MITSKQNEFIKLAASLKQKKARDEHGLYLVEGLRVVLDTLPVCPAARVIVAAHREQELRGSFGGAEVTVVADAVFNKLADTRNGQGVAAVCPVPKFAKEYKSPFCLFLDGVSDPGNLGTILRTACAAGFDEVYLAGECADVFNPKCVRSAMSAAAKVKTYSVTHTELDRLRAFGYTLVCGDMGGESIFTLPLHAEKVCLIVGGEAHGLSDAARAYADLFAAVPMPGDIESLNVSVSAAVLMYALRARSTQGF